MAEKDNSVRGRAEQEFVEAKKKPGTNAQAKSEGFRGFRTTCDGSLLLPRVRRCPAAASTAARALSLHQRCRRFAVASGPQSPLANRCHAVDYFPSGCRYGQEVVAMFVAVGKHEGSGVRHNRDDQVIIVSWLEGIDNQVQKSMPGHRDRDVIDKPIARIKVRLSTGP